MKKLISIMCVICLLINLTPVWAEETWSAEAWDQIVAALVSEDAVPVPESRRIQIKSSQVYLADPNKQGLGWMNIALISTDSPDIRHNFGRSEAVLVFRVNPLTGDFFLLSLPEYMKVSVAWCPYEMQLKYVNCFGGPLLAIDTINREFGLSVNRYCAINVNSFASIIDTFGGVPITLTEGEAEALGLDQGLQTLTGDQAVRYLKIQREWDEATHFRNLLESLLKQMTTGGLLGAALTMIDALLSMIDTNMTLDEIVAFAFSLVGQQELKEIAAYRVETNADGYVDEAAKQACRQFLYGGAAAK
ncbi:MAG: LCP family protein [Clostridia bacterium]|nr:LCP family protein [Clostridia bacterium]